MDLRLVLFAGLITLCRGEAGCKAHDYLDCLKNKTLTGHVVNSFRVSAPGPDECQHKCFLEDKCVSYNLGPVEGTIRSCELNDADHVSDPGHVVSKKDFEYCPIKNPCSSSPCTPYQWCTPDFYWDSVKCSDGRWTQWSGWSACLCPRTRTRHCITPQNTTGVCDGKDSDTESKECRAVSDIKGCSVPLGMQDRSIVDNQITASSFYVLPFVGFRYHPHFGRLHRKAASVLYIDGAWSAAKKQIGEYLQIDLGSIKWVTQIATQGGYIHVNRWWVTEYTLSFSNDTITWQAYKGDQECTKHFAGNVDINTVVKHELSVLIKARYVRFVIQKWRGNIAMRVELYGCTSV